MAGDADVARGPFTLLRDRTVGPYMVGKLMSSCGKWTMSIAAAVLMYDLTQSAVMVGLVSALQFVPLLVLAVWAGVLTDRVDRRLLVMAGRGTTGASVVLLGILFLVRGIDGFGGPPVLLAALFVAGSGFAISNPATHAILPSLVKDRRDLETALAVNAAVPSIARALGPAIGAGLLLLGGPGVALVVAGTADLAFTAVLSRLTIPKAKLSERPSILGGFRYLRQDRIAGLLVIGVACLGLGSDTVVTLTPPLASDLGGDAALVGTFTSLFGLGALLLTLTMRQFRKAVSLQFLQWFGFWLVAGGLLLVGLVPLVGVAVAGFFVGGLGFFMAEVAMTTELQQRVPDELRGRVMAIWGIAAFGSRPVAALVNGTIADTFGVRPAFVVVAVLTVLASLLVRGGRGRQMALQAT